MKAGKDAVGLDHSPIPADTTAEVTMTPIEAIPGHTTGIIDDITGELHNAHTQVLIQIILTVTLHITDHLHKEALQLTLEITVDHAFNQPTNPPRKPCTNLHKHSRRLQAKIYTKRNPRVTIHDPQMDCYSSEDHSSDSEEDSDLLN